VALGGRKLPRHEISLRSINPDNVVVIDTSETGHPKAIAEVDWDSALPPSIQTRSTWSNPAVPCESTRSRREKAYVRKVDVDYYTDAMTYTNVRVIDSFEKKRHQNAMIEHGEVQVVRKVTGYKKSSPIH